MKNIFTILFVVTLTIGNAQVWSNVGSGIANNNGRVESMCEYNGQLYVGGYFGEIGGINVRSIARWDGTTWDSVPGAYQFGTVEIFSMVVYNNELVVGGILSANSNYYNIAKWNGTTWSFLGTGINNRILGLGVYNNELYATGQFDHAGGIPTRGIARWDGTVWDSVGGGGLNQTAGFSGASLNVYNGKLYLAGGFQEVCGLPVHSIARWNGSIWDSVGVITNGGAGSLCSFNNKLYAGGYLSYNSDPTFRWINRWNDVSWDSVGMDFNGPPATMATYNNQLYVAGNFDSTGYQQALGIARWDDSQWSSVGSGLDLYHFNQDTVITLDTSYYTWEHIYTMYTYNNELYVGGQFLKIGGIYTNCIAKWHEVGASINEQVQQSLSVLIFPNPAATNTTFQITGSPGNKTLIIYDQLGKEILRKETAENQIELSVEGFVPGLYFYRIETGGERNASGKFIIAR
jgi:hypothetical protein